MGTLPHAPVPFVAGAVSQSQSSRWKGLDYTRRPAERSREDASAQPCTSVTLAVAGPDPCRPRASRLRRPAKRSIVLDGISADQAEQAINVAMRKNFYKKSSRKKTEQLKNISISRGFAVFLDQIVG
jgi:hypothetical protein